MRITSTALLLLAATYAGAQQLEQRAPMQPELLPAGTAIHMRLDTAIYTSSSKAGDGFAGRVTHDVVANGRTVIPVGTTLRGQVVRVAEPRRIKGRPSIELRPEQVTMPDGSILAINAVVAQTSEASETEVDEEGRIRGAGIERRDKVEMAAGAAAGAGVGAWAGGVKGSFIGAAIGGGSAVAYWLTKRKSAYLAPGTEMVLELKQPVVMAAVSSD